MYPIWVGLENRSATKPSLPTPAPIMNTDDQDGEHRRERDRLGRVAVGPDQRQDRGGDHRAERRVRAEHQDPRRAEHRVGEQAHDRRVEPGDRRQAGQLRVRHALGHQQRGQHQAGDEVLRDPRALVGADRADARDEALIAVTAPSGSARPGVGRSTAGARWVFFRHGSCSPAWWPRDRQLDGPVEPHLRGRP